MSKNESDAKEVEHMVRVWEKIKDSVYEGGLDKMDETARALVTLSSALITVGFTVTAALVNAKILQVSHASLWLSFSGFFCFMLSTISSTLVVYRRPFDIVQISEAPAISKAWHKISSTKYRFMKWAYIFFIAGIILEIVAIASLIG